MKFINFILISGGSMMGHTSGGFHGHHPPGYSPLINGGLSRPPLAPGAASYSPAHFPAQLVYWPGCPGYPSPPISPNNYYMTTPATPSPSSLLTPTSSISSLSNGVTSPGPGHASPPLTSQQNALVGRENIFVKGCHN